MARRVHGWLKRCLAIGLASSTALAAPPPEVLPAHLTLDDALRVFRAQGLDLIIADAAVSSAEGDLKVAGAVANPVVGGSYSRTFTYQANDSSCMAPGLYCTPNGFGASLNDQAALSDTVTGKRGLRLQVAHRALAAVRQSRLDTQRNLEFQVKGQYIQAVLSRDQLDFALDVQKTSAQVFELNQVRYRAGSVSEADVARVEAAKLEADQAVALARQALAVNRLGLAYLLGVRGQAPTFDVDADLPRYVVPAALQSATTDSLLQLAREHRPDLKAVTFQRDGAQTAISLAQRQRVPDFTLNLAYQEIGYGGAGTNAALTPPTLTAGLSFPLPLFYQQQGEVQRAAAQLRAQDAQQAKIEAQIIDDVGSAFTSCVTTRELVERMQTRLLDRVARSRDLVNIQYQKGAASLLEFLDAQRTYIAVNQEYLQDLANYWTALFQLEQAVGADLRPEQK